MGLGLVHVLVQVNALAIPYRPIVDVLTLCYNLVSSNHHVILCHRLDNNSIYRNANIHLILCKYHQKGGNNINSMGKNASQKSMQTDL